MTRLNQVDETYMRMAEEFASLSKARRKKVGCLIVKDKNILSSGYNGMPTKSIDDSCEIINDDGSMTTKPEVLHAESNAAMKLAKTGGTGSAGSTCYVTLSPCIECAKLMNQAGIARVVYREQYRVTAGIEFLLNHNVLVDQLPERT